MTRYFIAYEVEMITRDHVEDFDGEYEDIELKVNLKSSGNTSKISNEYIVSQILKLLEKI